MSCIKTGAVVFLPEYNVKVVGDLYDVPGSNAIVLHYRAKGFYSDCVNRDVTHEIYIGEGFHQRFSGILVVPSGNVKVISEDELRSKYSPK